MSFINTIPEDQAEGPLAARYQAEIDGKGFVPNYIKAFSHRPETLDAWEDLLMSFRQGMRLRRYELVTVAAVKALGCTY